MAKANPSTILLKGSPIAKEGLADATIQPGMLLDVSGAGDAFNPRKLRVGPHGTAGGNGPVHIARELEIAGGSIEDAYSEDDTVLYWTAKSGDEYYALLATGSETAPGTLLESAGNGAFRELASGVALARALETVDNDPGTAMARVKVEII